MASRDDDYHVPKKQRIDDGNGVPSSRRGGGYDNNLHKTEDSPVVHIRGLSDYATRQDLFECCEKFGRVAEVLLISRKKQALVEFEDIQDSIRCINYSKNAQIYITGSPAGFNFSTSQRIDRDKLTSQIQRDPLPINKANAPVNHVLLFTVLEPIHPITIEVMKTICTPFGKILRIVIFRKTGVQSMVEFDNVESAKSALAALHGQDIYTNCCTLRVEYAKADRVNVRRNDPMESWDFTMGNEAEPPLRNRPLLADPAFNEGGSCYPDSRGGYGMSSSFHDVAPSSIRSRDEYGRGSLISDAGRREYRGSDRYAPEMDSYSRFSDVGPSRSIRNQGLDMRGRGPMLPDNNTYSGGYGMSDSMPSVVMIYGLNMDNMNCKKLFNLLCLYGNVNRIKFLMKKEGTVMVEFNDPQAADGAIQHLNNTSFHGIKMQVAKSKQTNVQEVLNPHQLPDGTSSYEDFSRCRNNRFTKNPEKNRIQAPSKVLHYFNAPLDMSDSDLKKLFEDLGCQVPLKTKKFNQKSDRSSSGLIEFEDTSTSVEALIAANHYEVDAPNGRSPFIFKLCFSSNHNMD